jgi:hypothetical protein
MSGLNARARQPDDPVAIAGRHGTTVKSRRTRSGLPMSDTQTIAVNHQSTLSSGAINEARAQYTRSRLGAPVNDLVGPAVNINGVAAFGTATSSPTARDLDAFQLIDTMTV